MGFTASDLDTAIRILRDAARAEILPRFRNLAEGEAGEKTSALDLVTVADTGMERAAADGFARAFPDITVVGEEGVFDDPGLLDAIAGPGRVVILDPIDGTWNFAHGLPLFGTIAALVEGGETVGGIIYDPLQDDCVAALKGQGAWHIGPGGRQRLTAAPGAEIGAMSGYVSTFLFDPALRPGILAATAPFQRVLSLRCSAYEYRTLAQGSVAFGLSAELKPWDHAAGVLIHAEAGGTARLIDGTPYRPTLRKGAMLVAPDDATWTAIAEHFRAAAPNLTANTRVH